MPTVHTALGECLRTGIDALRGLGFSFSVADRLARTLTWSEAVGLNGLRHVRQDEDRIRLAMTRRFGIRPVACAGADFNVLDASGKSILEAGPRALDLANAGARSDGAGVVVVKDTFGWPFLGEIAQTSVERGLSIFILARGCAPGCPEADAAILGVPDSLAEVAAESGSLQLADVYAPLLERHCGSEAAAEIRALLSRPAHDGATLDVVFVSLRPDRAAGLAELFQTCSRDNGLKVVDRQLARWRQALHDGFEVDEADWAYLYSLVARIRVQTSEHSRTHAG